MMHDIVIQVSGKEHSGKTSLIAVIASLLEANGFTNVAVQRADPQIVEKLENLDAATTRAKDAHILIREFNTPV